MDPVTVVLLGVVAVIAFALGRISAHRSARRRLIGQSSTTWAEVESGTATPRPSLITPRTVDERIGSATRVTIDAEVLRGRRMMAIRLYREATGVPLQEAAEAIDSWEITDGPRATPPRTRAPSEPDAPSSAPAGEDWPSLPPSNRQPGSRG